MLKTIEGIYQDGQIRFTEPPQNIGDPVKLARLENSFKKCNKNMTF